MTKISTLSVNSTLPPLLATLLLLLTISSSAAELKNITPEQLKSLQNNGALVVDIRTASEWAASGTIPDSKKLEFFNKQGEFDEKKWLDGLNKHHTSTKQPVILVCRSGIRSSMVGTHLTNKLGMNNIYHLQNGIMSWIKAGNKISKD